MQLEFFEFTDQGDRTANQDYMAHLIEDGYGLFIVADGLGGHYAGEKASEFFCQGMLNCALSYSHKISDNPIGIFTDWVKDAIVEMKTLFGNDPDANQAYTTCAILYLDAHRTITAHCGDSRVYRLNPKELLWRTRDHSIPQDLLSIGLITEEELAQHPEQNHLTRSINIGQEHPIDIQEYPPIETTETFVLCTDGFWAQIKPDELLQIADFSSDKETLFRLTKLSVDRASPKSDNVTVMSVRTKR